jgi:hypothetical protein
VAGTQTHTARTVHVVEPTTGDELLITALADQTSLAVRHETGEWISVQLHQSTARAVADALAAAATVSSEDDSRK